MKGIVSTTNAPAAVGPYSQAVKAGQFLFCSGQIPIDPATGQFVPGGVTEQAKQVLNNVKAVLEAAGYSLADVIKATVFATSMNDFAAVNGVYATYFEKEPPAVPSSSALPKSLGNKSCRKNDSSGGSSPLLLKDVRMKDTKIAGPVAACPVSPSFRALRRKWSPPGRWEMLSFKASQVRKDLSYFGDRQAGVGIMLIVYSSISRITRPQALVHRSYGVGKLGGALGYRRSGTRSFRLRPLRRRPKSEHISGTPCYPYEPRVPQRRYRCVIITAPTGAAQSVEQVFLQER